SVIVGLEDVFVVALGGGSARANPKERAAPALPDQLEVSVARGKGGRLGLAKRGFAEAVGAEYVPKHVVELARVPQPGLIRQEHDRPVDGTADRHVLFGRHRQLLEEFPPQLGVVDHNRADTEVTADLVVIYGRAQ